MTQHSSLPSAAERLGKRLLSALQAAAAATRRGEPYLERESSVRQLAVFGLVEQRNSQPGYWATERGLAIAEGRSNE